MRSKGMDVASIGPENLGVQDHVVMQIAIDANRTILTFDRDYGELIFKHNYRPPMGVIYLRLLEYTADEPGILIEQLLNQTGFSPESALTVLDRSGIRQRKY